METHEGWTVGHEEFVIVNKVVAVRMSKGGISEYLIKSIKDKTWVSKKDAIAMAEQGRLHAIVVHTKNGS